MRCGSCAAVAAVALLDAHVTAPAQGVPPAARAEVVRLDVVVTDASGRPVRDLTREDFEVLEDGKAQRPTTFLFKGTAPLPSSTPRSTPPSEEARPPERYVVIVADDVHMARPSVEGAKDTLRRFVDELVAPDDYVAFVATSSPGATVQPTRDRAVLKQAINGLSSRQAPAMAAAQAQALTAPQAELILRGDRAALQLAVDVMLDNPAAVSGPRATVEAAQGVTPAGVEPGQLAAAQEAQREARAVLADALRFSAITLGRLDDVVRGISPLPGRKVCLLVSDGFLVGKGTSEELTRQLRQVADAATRSGAVVYALDTGGVTPGGADAGAAGPAATPGLGERVARLAQQESREALQGLADATGGFLVRGTTEPASGLRRMLEEDGAYYLMAYEPSNTRRDGRFRKIEVRLHGHPDLLVRTRSGYFASDDRKPGGRSASPPGQLSAGAAAPRALDEAEARAVLREPIPPDGVPLRLAADYLDLPPAGPRAIVQANVDLAGVRWQEVGGRRRAALELVGDAYDTAGKPVRPPFGRRFDLDLGPKEYEQARKAGLKYQEQLPLEPGRYEIRMVVREPGAPPLGGATREVEIPDLAKGGLTLSSVFLSSSDATGGSAAGGRAGADVAVRDVQALRRFQPSDTLYFQLYVYNAARDDTGATGVELQAQIHSGSKLVAASRLQPVTFQQKDGVPLPQSNAISLAGLGPGTYELRVVVVDRTTNTTASRSTDFTVE